MQGIAVDFFNACEGGKGWNATRRYVSSSAPFHAQVTDALPGPKLSEVKTIEGYTEWMAGVVKEFGPKASCNPTKTTFPKPQANQPDPLLACPRQATVEVKAAAWDSGRFTAVFVAVFMGYSEYVYSLKLDSSECRIDGMTKIWNDGYAKAHIPPAA